MTVPDEPTDLTSPTDPVSAADSVVPLDGVAVRVGASSRGVFDDAIEANEADSAEDVSGASDGDEVVTPRRGATSVASSEERRLARLQRWQRLSSAGRSVPAQNEAGFDSFDSLDQFEEPRQVVHKGRVVDPDVAEPGDLPLEQWSSEPPPIGYRRREKKGKKAFVVRDQPSLRPYTHEPRPSSEELLDPDRAPMPIPKHSATVASPSVLSPRMTAVFGALFGLAGIVAVFALLHKASPPPTAFLVPDDKVGALSQSSPSSQAAPEAAGSSARSASSRRQPLMANKVFEGLANFEEEGIALPGPWRVSSLSSDPNVRVISGTVGLDPFVKTLQSKGVSKSETYRILAAFKQFDAFKRPRKNDVFTVAIDRTKGRVVGFELEVGALEIYQAKPNSEDLLVGSRLDLQVATRTRSTAVRISDGDLATNLKQAGLREAIVPVLDKAFDGRASVASMPPGSSLRVILQEKTALGRFAEYDYILALEYISSKPDTQPMRLYRFKDGSRYGYFNQDGKEPYRGGWRMPCPGAPISSPFNPKRMHPVLKRIHPHNGTDFAAPTGTPIHATSYGTVDFIGVRGPAGNLIIIKHPGKIESYYMHLHRFATGLKQGDKVETFQVIGYVGNTGRSTGPHLHFGIKKNDVWIDPMSLKLDGDRVVTASLRADFEREKASLDEQLDAIALPAPLELQAEEDVKLAAEQPSQDQDNRSPNPADPNEPSSRSGGATPTGASPKKPSRAVDDDEELEEGSVDDEPYDDVL